MGSRSRVIESPVSQCLETSSPTAFPVNQGNWRTASQGCGLVVGVCTLVGLAEDLLAWRRRDWLCLFVPWVVERRSAGSGLQRVILLSQREAVVMVGKRLQKLWAGLESSFVVVRSVGVVQRSPPDFGKAHHMFGHGLRSRQLPVDSKLHLEAGESSLDIGWLPEPLAQLDYMPLEQKWRLPDFEEWLKLEGLEMKWW